MSRVPLWKSQAYVQIRCYSGQNIVERRERREKHSLSFSSDRPINNVLLSLHFLILRDFFFLVAHNVRFRWPSSIRGARRRIYQESRDQRGPFVSKRYTRKLAALTTCEAITSRRYKSVLPFFQIVMATITASATFLILILGSFIIFV